MPFATCRFVEDRPIGIARQSCLHFDPDAVYRGSRGPFGDRRTTQSLGVRQQLVRKGVPLIGQSSEHALQLR